MSEYIKVGILLVFIVPIFLFGLAGGVTIMAATHGLSDFPTPRYCELMGSLGEMSEDDVVRVYETMGLIPISWMDHDALRESAHVFEESASVLYHHKVVTRDTLDIHLAAAIDQASISQAICATLDIENMNSFALVVMGRAR